MKKEIHPNYQPLILQIGKDVFETNSTFSGGKLLVEIDFRKHRAWDSTQASRANESNKNVADFNKKFSGLSFGIKKPL